MSDKTPGLADVREARGMSQTSLAWVMDVGQSRIGRIELTELRAMQIVTVARYVEALGGQLSLHVSLPEPEAVFLLPVGPAAEPPDLRYVTVSEVARRLQIHNNTVRNWVDKGIMQADRTPSGYRRVLETEVQRLERKMKAESLFEEESL